MELGNCGSKQIVVVDFFFSTQKLCHSNKKKRLKNLLHEKFVDVFLSCFSFCFFVFCLLVWFLLFLLFFLLKINSCVKNMSHRIIIVVVIMFIVCM